MVTTQNDAETRHVRSNALTAAMTTGPALLVAGTIITPQFDASVASYLATFAEHAERVQLGAVLFVVGHVVLAPALVWVSIRSRQRVASVAAVAAAAGAMIFAGLGFTRLAEVAVATELGAVQGTPAIEALNALPGTVGLLIPGLVGMIVGTLVMLISLARGGVVPGWLLITFVAGQVGVMTGGDGTPLGIAGSTMLAITFAALAVLGGPRLRRDA